MRTWRWLLVATVACGGSSSNANPSGQMLVVEGVTNNAISACVSNVPFAPTIEVRNRTADQTVVMIDRRGFTTEHFALSKDTLGIGEAATLTLGPFDPKTDALVDSSFDIYPIPPGHERDEFPPSSPLLAPTKVSIHFDFDDRDYKLSGMTEQIATQDGRIDWTVVGSGFPAPKLVFTGPFEESMVAGAAGFLKEGFSSFRITSSSPPGQEVSGTVRVATVRCPDAMMLEASPPLAISGRR